MTAAARSRVQAPQPSAKPLSRDQHVQQTVRDPFVCVADRWRVFERTDRVFIVVDLELMARYVVPATVAVCRTLEEATAKAKELAAGGAK